MKLIKNNIVNKISLVTIFILGTLATISCNKDVLQDGQGNPTGKSRLMVRVTGLTESLNTGKGASLGKLNQEANSTQDIQLVSQGGFDAIVAVDNNASSSDIDLKHSKLNKTAAVLPGPNQSGMADGTKYRLFLYKKTNGSYTYETSFQFVVGQEAPVELAMGTYKWVALSYNTEDSVADRGADDTFVLPENEDVLYAASTADIVVAEVEVPINLVFTRLYARIAIEINTLGMFAPIKSATLAVSGQSTHAASLNLTTGAVTVASSGDTPTLTSSDFEAIEGDSTRMVAYFYTANTTAQNLSVNVSNLKIKLDNGLERNFGSTPVTFAKTITPERGKSHRFLVGITESAIAYGGVQWSRSNLYFRTSDALGSITPYRFYHTNPYNPNKDESFFAFRGHLPRLLARKNEAEHKDPCALVYPKGLWKTPTSAEVGVLTSNQGLVDGLLGSVLGVLGLTPGTSGAAYGTNYIEYTPTTPANTAYGLANSSTNKLRFNYNGLQSDISLVEELVTLNLGELGTTAAFWSNDRVLEGGILALLSTGVGAWSYLGSTAPQAPLYPVLGYDTRALASKGAGVLNITALGLDVTGSGFMNVRCVRDNTFAAKSQAAGYDPMPKPADWAR